MLGHEQSRAVKALGYLLLFDPKNDLIRALDDMRRRWSARVRGT